MGEVEIDCIKEYFDLKDRASCGDFLFSKEYNEMLAQVHTKHGPKLVANFVKDKNVSRDENVPIIFEGIMELRVKIIIV